MTSNSQFGAPSCGGYGYNRPNLASGPFSADGVRNEPSAPPPYSEYDTYPGPPTQSAAPSVGVGDSRPLYIRATNPTVISSPRKHRHGPVSRMMGVVIRSARAPATILRNTLSQTIRPPAHQHQGQQPLPPPPPGFFYAGRSAAAPGGVGSFGGARVPANNSGYLLTGTGAGMMECGSAARGGGGGGGGGAAPANSARAAGEGGGMMKRVWLTKSSNIFSSLDVPTSVRFQDVFVRHAFVRNVYGILTVQMTLVCGVAAAFLFLDPIKTYTREHAQTISVSAVVLMCAMFLFGCMCSEAWKYAPGKYSCLVVLAASLSFLFGALSSLYHSEVPMVTAGMAAITTLTLVVFTCQSKIAFTHSSGMVAVLGVVFVLCSTSAIVASSLFGKMETVLNCVYAALAVLVLCVHQAYNLGLMVGGERDAPITMEHDIYVAIKLFLNLLLLPLDSIFILIDLSDRVFGWRSPGAGRV